MEVEVKCQKCPAIVSVSIQWWDDPVHPPPIMVICAKCRGPNDGPKGRGKRKVDMQTPPEPQNPEDPRTPEDPQNAP